MLDESFMILKIREYGRDIFREDTIDSRDSSIDDSLSDSELFIEERLKPFIKPLKPSKKKMSDKRLARYVSPSSQQQINSLQTGRLGNHNESVKTANIRKKIFDTYSGHKNYEYTQKQAFQHEISHKQSDFKPKHIEKQPLFNQMIQRNLFERFHTQAEYHRKPSKISEQQSEEKWKKFHQKNIEWSESKSNSIMKDKIKQKLKLKQEVDHKFQRKPPSQMTVDDCLHKLRCHAQKLKQKLNDCSFSPVLYETERKKYKMQKWRERSRSKSQQDKQSPSLPKAKEHATEIKNPNRFILN